MGKAVDVRITGRVQGVSFRWYTREQALRLGVAGWVRNDPDGSVVGHLEGEPGSVDALVAWCARGPSMAAVEHVAVEPSGETGGTDFHIHP